MTLPHCDCPACRRAVEILATSPRVISVEEAEARRSAYETDRAGHRRAIPVKTREECEAGDGHQLELVMAETMPPVSD